MKRKSIKLKKTLTKDRVLEVLEIIGASPAPISTYEIAKMWGKIYCPDRNVEPNIKYIYEVIKRLYVPSHSKHPERFLAISIKTKLQNEILALENKFDLLQAKPGETRSRRFSPDDEMEFTRAALRIGAIKGEPRNWRYSLNLKGLLLYLYNAQQYGRKIRTIYDVFNNVANRRIAIMDMKFLCHFEIFRKLYDEITLVEILTQIAVELKDLLSRTTPEFLRSYVITRCYEEIMIEISMNNHIFNRARRNDKERLRSLQNYKVKILSDLIPIEKEKLKEIQDELQLTI